MIFHMDQLGFVVFKLRKSSREVRKNFADHGITADRVYRVNRMFREHMAVFQNTNRPDDPGLLRIKEAEDRIGKRLTLNDAYRIVQLETALFCASSPGIEPGTADNWAWLLGNDGRELTEHEHDLVFLMLSRNGWLKPSRLLEGIDARVKKLKGHVTVAQKFGTTVPDDGK